MIDEAELQRLYLFWRFGVPLQRKHPNYSVWHDLREWGTADTYDYFKHALVGTAVSAFDIRIKPVDQS